MQLNINFLFTNLINGLHKKVISKIRDTALFEVYRCIWGT